MAVTGVIADLHDLNKGMIKHLADPDNHLLLHILVHVGVPDHGELITPGRSSVRVSHPGCAI